MYKFTYNNLFSNNLNLNNIQILRTSNCREVTIRQAADLCHLLNL